MSNKLPTETIPLGDESSLPPVIQKINTVLGLDNEDEVFEVPEYLLKEDVEELTEKQKELFLSENSDMALRVARLLSTLLSFRKGPPVTLRDIHANSYINKPFVTIRLWERITQYNILLTQQLDNYLKNKTPKTKKTTNNSKKSYLDALNSSFKAELDPIVSQAFNGGFLHGLSRALSEQEHGNIFATIDKRFSEEWLKSFGLEDKTEGSVSGLYQENEDEDIEKEIGTENEDEKDLDADLEKEDEKDIENEDEIDMSEKFHDFDKDEHLSEDDELDLEKLNDMGIEDDENDLEVKEDDENT